MSSYFVLFYYYFLFILPYGLSASELSIYVKKLVAYREEEKGKQFPCSERELRVAVLTRVQADVKTETNRKV